MKEKTVFCFLQKDNEKLFKLTQQCEKQLYRNPHLSLLHAKLFIEDLIKEISKLENIKDFDSIKSKERYNSLIGASVIDKNIQKKVEWVQNTVTMTSKKEMVIGTTDAIKAHNYIYEISVWFMSLYFPESLEFTLYKVPANHQENMSEVLSISEKDSRLSRDCNRELKIKKNVIPEDVEPKVNTINEKSIDMEKTLIMNKFIEKNNLLYIDMRNKNGALWIIENQKLKDKLDLLEKQGIFFKYALTGSGATKFKPGWYMTNKDVGKLSASQTNRVLINDEALLNNNIQTRKPLPKIKKGDETTKSTHTLLNYYNKKIEVEAPLNSFLIEDLGIKGCENFVRKLKSIGVYCLKDFSEPLDDIHLQLRSVGESTVAKFWMQLEKSLNSVNPLDTSSISNQIETTERIISFNKKTITLSKEMYQKKIEIEDFSEMDFVIKILHSQKIKTYKDIPSDFNEIWKLKGIGRKKAEKLFILMSNIIRKEKYKKENENLSVEERLKKEQTIFNNWIIEVMENEEVRSVEKISEKYFKLMKKKYEAVLLKEHLTLEELGKEEGVTRERIRQIISKGDKKILHYANDIYLVLIDYLKKNGSLTKVILEENNSFLDYLLINSLELKGVFLYEISNMKLISSMNSEEFIIFKKEIKADIKANFYLKVISEMEFKKYCSEKSKKSKIDVLIIEKVALESIHWFTLSEGILKGTRKKDIVEMVMMQYPKGVEIFKNEEELIRKANYFMSEGFLEERSFSPIACRSDMSDRILLWGRGLYIHVDFLNVDKDWIYKVQSMAEMFLIKEGFIHVKKLFDEVQIEAAKRGINNEYALYSMIRKYPNGTLSLIKFPHIQREGDIKQANFERIIEFIQARGGEVTYQELFETFVEKKGWKKFTLESNLSINQEILQYKHTHYTLLSLYDHIQPSQLSFINEEIARNLKDRPYIHVNSIYSSYELILTSMNIKTSRILYAILKKFGEVNANLKRFPYIVSTNYTSDLLTGKEHLENFILEQNDIVQKEEVNEWITDIFGEGNSLLELTLLNSNKILYYSKGRFGEYIHRDTIGMNISKEVEVKKVLEKKFLEITNYKNIKYATLSELYDPKILPVLSTDISWSKDLLGDLIKKSKEWITIGSYDEIVLDINDGIIENAEFVKYIITKMFQGSAKIVEVQKFLREIRYSKNGDLLQDVKDKMTDGKAGFRKLGDEILINELIEVDVYEK